MALKTPRFIDTHEYSASDMRSVLAHLPLQQGVVGSVLATTPLKVTTTSPLSRAVRVHPGAAWVDSGWSSSPERYHVVSDAIETLSVLENSWGLPRVDSVFLSIGDTVDGLTSNDVPLIRLAPGVPTAGATLDNPVGAPAAGNTELLLAHVNAPLGSASVSSDTLIRDYRPHARGSRSRIAFPDSYSMGIIDASSIRMPIYSGLALVSMRAWVQTAASTFEASFWPLVDGATVAAASGGAPQLWTQQEASAQQVNINCQWLISVSAGSHVFSIGETNGASMTVQAVASGFSSEILVEEIILPTNRNNE